MPLKSINLNFRLDGSSLDKKNAIMKRDRGLLLLFFILFSIPLKAEYRIEGRVNLGSQWQPKIFMAAIEKLSDYYRASPDLIVSIADINANGEFVLEGDNLPSEPRFYRLYLMKKYNDDYDACLYVGGDDHNFLHVIMDNHAQLEIQTADGSGAPFQGYVVLGNRENQLMKELADLVYPSFYFYQIKFPTELRFSEKKLHSDLKNFVDTCQSTLVSLAAINHTDFDEYFQQDETFYKAFGERLLRERPASVYTNNYMRKLRYYSDEPIEVLPAWVAWILGFMTMLLISMAFLIYHLNKKLNAQLLTLKNGQQKVAIEERLTKKEKEILDLLLENKSNKEIATALFIELSTVKTHINRIYSKLNISSRSELSRLGENIKL